MCSAKVGDELANGETGGGAIGDHGIVKSACGETAVVVAREGHAVAWEFGDGGSYTGRMLIDGEIYMPSEATKKFLRAG